MSNFQKQPLTEKQQRIELSNYKMEQEMHSKFINDPLLFSMIGLKTISEEFQETQLGESRKIEKLIQILLSGKGNTGVVSKRIVAAIDKQPTSKPLLNLADKEDALFAEFANELKDKIKFNSLAKNFASGCTKEQN
jgi:hypothetical protein